MSACCGLGVGLTFFPFPLHLPTGKLVSIPHQKKKGSISLLSFIHTSFFSSSCMKCFPGIFHSLCSFIRSKLILFPFFFFLYDNRMNEECCDEIILPPVSCSLFWFFWLEFFEARANNGYMHFFKQSLVYLILK